jgi:sortase A
MTADRKKSSNKKNTRSNIAIILIFVVGAVVLLYPAVSNLWNRYHNLKLGTEYSKTVSTMSKSDAAVIWKKARAYNARHQVNVIADAFDNSARYHASREYSKLLDPMGSGIMGYIDIPRIEQQLVIYHGTGTRALSLGVGHVEGTSLPVGGKSTHAVLAGHRGLPSAKLFTDLDQMKKGDYFFIHVMNKTLSYRVDQIKVVKPEQTGDLAIVRGKDYVTLITCTPYGVNSHRLLVRGVRSRYDPGRDKISSLGIILRFILIAAVLILLFALILRKMSKKGASGSEHKKK